MITKTKLPTTIEVPFRTTLRSRWGYDRSDLGSTTSTVRYPQGGETITYAGPLPARVNGHCVWKDCHHVTELIRSGTPGSFVWHGYQTVNRYYETVHASVAPYRSGSSRNPPNGSFDMAALKGVVDQIDLNTEESVLLYSGVLQAVPLLGGVFKLNSILKNAAKRLSKDFRRKPFTTVVKSLISADFIDRFVVSPTLDDARRFVDATNYVLRTMQTAYQRNAMPTALSSTVVKIVSDTQGSINDTSTNPSPRGTWKRRSQLVSKAFMKLDVRYDTRAIDPIKFWAARVGLTKPLDSVWDLVPFSFVIDYFTRAGDMIAGLSSEMADQDGLRGRVTRLHDCWGTLTRSDYTDYDITGCAFSFGSYRQDFQEFTPGSWRVGVKDFTRFRIANPFATIASIKESSGLFNLSLTPRRLGTLAELVFQAKL